MSHPLSEPELAALRAVAEDVLKNHRTLVYLPAVKLLALLAEVQELRAEVQTLRVVVQYLRQCGVGDINERPTER